jgi:hypothetical protein
LRLEQQRLTAYTAQVIRAAGSRLKAGKPLLLSRKLFDNEDTSSFQLIRTPFRTRNTNKNA